MNSQEYDDLTYRLNLLEDLLYYNPVKFVIYMNNTIDDIYPDKRLRNDMNYDYSECVDLLNELKKHLKPILITVKLGNITDECVDVIVNAANNELKGGSGVDGAIHNAAGWDKLDEACRKIGYCETGKAVIIPAFDMKNVKYIIHTVGPFCSAHSRYIETPTELEMTQLYNCYYNSLCLADEWECAKISFPSIATGIYGFPLEYAPKIVKKAISDYEEKNKHIREINMVCFDEETKSFYDNEFSVISD